MEIWRSSDARQKQFWLFLRHGVLYRFVRRNAIGDDNDD